MAKYKYNAANAIWVFGTEGLVALLPGPVEKVMIVEAQWKTDIEVKNTHCLLVWLRHCFCLFYFNHLIRYMQAHCCPDIDWWALSW